MMTSFEDRVYNIFQEEGEINFDQLCRQEQFCLIKSTLPDDLAIEDIYPKGASTFVDENAQLLFQLKEKSQNNKHMISI